MSQDLHAYNQAQRQIERAVAAEDKLKAAIAFIETIAEGNGPLASRAAHWLAEHGA